MSIEDMEPENIPYEQAKALWQIAKQLALMNENHSDLGASRNLISETEPLG